MIMTAETFQTVTTGCLIAGTSLLAIEAIGRERAEKLETVTKVRSPPRRPKRPPLPCTDESARSSGELYPLVGGGFLHV